MEKSLLLKELGKVDFFSCLSAEEQEEILDICKILHFEEEEQVIGEGESSPFVYAVVSGMVSIMLRQESGKEIFISSVGEGDVFGETGIFFKKRRTASAISNNATLIQLDRERLLEFIKSCPSAGNKILMMIIYSLLNKLRDANKELSLERKANVNEVEVEEMLDFFLKE